MEKRTFTVPNIGCDGCVRTVEATVRDVVGVKSVKGQVDNKQVVVEYDAPATWEAIRTALTEVDYAPAES